MKGLFVLLIFVLIAFALYRLREKSLDGKDANTVDDVKNPDIIDSIKDKTVPIVKTMAEITDANVSASKISIPPDVNSRSLEKEKSNGIIELFDMNTTSKGTLSSELNALPSTTYNPSVIPQSLVTGY